MKKNLILLSSVLMALTACSKKESTPAVESTHSLVLYYSQTNATKQVAEAVQQLTGADIEAIQAVNAYDGDFQQTIARCQQEMADGIVPELVAFEKNVADYDTIYLGFPIWFGTYAPPVAAVIQNNDFTGKVLVPFCTFGSGGNTGIDNLKAALPNATILPSYGVRNARIAAAPAEVKQWLVNNGILPGEKVIPVEFSEQQPLTEVEKQIFDAACSSYAMPLGSPVSVGSRLIDKGTEYLFTVEANGASAQIYVTAAEGAAPEFTQVVR